MIVVLIIGTVGVDTNGKPDLSTTGIAILFVLAFIVGYQQMVFHKLLARTVSVVLGPGSGNGEGGGPTFATLSTLSFGQVKINDAQSLSLPISNIGEAQIAVPSSAVKIQGDNFAVTQFPAKIASGQIGNLLINFSPTEAKVYEATATILIEDTSRSVSLSGTGVQ